MEIKPAMVAITAFVVITVIAAVLMPVIQDATDETYAVYNNESNFYSVILPSDGGTMTGSIAADNTLTINGEVITSTSQRYVIMGDTFYLRYSGSAHSLTYWDGAALQTINHVPVSFSVADGVLTYVDESVTPNTSVDIPFTWMAYNTATESDYREIVVTSGVKTIYVNSTEDIYAVSKTDTSIISICKGQITDNTVEVGASVSYTPHEINNVTGVEYLQISSTAGSSDILYTFTENGTEKTEFYGNVLVPFEVKGYHDPPGKSYVDILNVIPLLVIASVLIGVVAYVIRTKQ